jgi:hypothetical protein
LAAAQKITQNTVYFLTGNDEGQEA